MPCGFTLKIGSEICTSPLPSRAIFHSCSSPLAPVASTPFVASYARAELPRRLVCTVATRFKSGSDQTIASSCVLEDEKSSLSSELTAMFSTPKA